MLPCALVNGVKKPSVWTLVLGWNHAEDTIECLRSLQASEGVDLKLFYTDNGSTPDQVERVCREVPAATVIRHPQNVGVPRGFNAGIAYVGNVGDAVVDFTALGDAVNVSARMQQHAAGGELLVAQLAMRMARGVQQASLAIRNMGGDLGKLQRLHKFLRCRTTARNPKAHDTACSAQVLRSKIK